MIGAAIKALTGGGLSALDGILARFVRDKDALEAHRHAETIQQQATYAAEFAPRANRTWWDSFVDGLNRLPRPLMAFAVIGLMAWAPIDPVGFSAAMGAYALVPEWLAGTLFGIAAFYFTARHFEKRLRFKGPSADQVRQVAESVAAVRAIDSPPPANPAPGPADPASVTNPSLAAWARARRGSG